MAGTPGGTIYMLKNATDFDYYDPQRVYTGEDLAFFGATIMRALVAYKYSEDPAEGTTLVPDMATDTGTPNADATQWTFTLRDGLTWQDGSPLKCEDIKYGVSRTFATDVINGGPTYAIAVSRQFPKDADRAASAVPQPARTPRPALGRSAARPTTAASTRPSLCDGNDDHLQPDADRRRLQLHHDARLRRCAEPGRPPWR